jgi:hypothetical protein
MPEMVKHFESRQKFQKSDGIFKKREQRRQQDAKMEALRNEVKQCLQNI